MTSLYNVFTMHDVYFNKENVLEALTVRRIYKKHFDKCSSICLYTSVNNNLYHRFMASSHYLPSADVYEYH